MEKDYIQDEINKLVNGFRTAPYLFVGSGFSRRYLGLEDWEGLLRKFTTGIKDYEYYRSTSNSNLPKAAHQISIDFNDLIWTSEDIEHKTFLVNHKSKLLNTSSALKITISDYLSSFSLKNTISEYEEELSLLKNVNVEGIITTNWDCLLEELYPHFSKIVGQDELIYSNPYGIAEIFKIHGCSEKPESLVLTDDDYNGFNQRNAYLAAKLVTYFVENPVIFIGYSVTDENITEILTSIIRCLGESQINKLSQNLIFIQRASGNDEITQTLKVIGNAHIPITVLKLTDFGKMYRPLCNIKRKIPIRLLRYFREQLYEFVHGNDPNSKIVVMDIEETTKLDDVEFAIGVGIHQQLGQKGYDRIQIGNLIEDVLTNNGTFDPLSLVEKTIPDIQGNVPIFKYFNQLDDFDIKQLQKSAKKAYSKQDRSDFTSSQYKSVYEREWKKKSIEDLYLFDDFDKAIRIIPFYPFSSEDEVRELGVYLRGICKYYFKEGEPLSNIQNSYFRKIVCLYDFLNYHYEW